MRRIEHLFSRLFNVGYHIQRVNVELIGFSDPRIVVLNPLSISLIVIIISYLIRIVHLLEGIA